MNSLSGSTDTVKAPMGILLLFIWDILIQKIAHFLIQKEAYWLFYDEVTFLFYSFFFFWFDILNASVTLNSHFTTIKIDKQLKQYKNKIEVKRNKMQLIQLENN